MNDDPCVFRRTDHSGRVFAAGAVRPELKRLVFPFTNYDQRARRCFGSVGNGCVGLVLRPGARLIISIFSYMHDFLLRLRLLPAAAGETYG